MSVHGFNQSLIIILLNLK